MFRFGEFELDLDRYELRRAGEVVKAEPRILEVLNYLIAQRERVVSKEELLDTIWKDVHVSESALTTTIRDARRALNDSPTEPQWIRTIYGRGFRFVGTVENEAARTAAQAPVVAPAPAPVHEPAPAKSIAVLPFTDLSPGRDQSHFCDGMAEELINTLTRIQELRVISRATAFDFRSDDDVRDLGRKLGVRHVLRGSVRKADDRLRITVHLVDTQTGHHVWSEKYDRQVGDIFAMQEEIAEKTARVLLGVFAERNRAAFRSTPVRIDAYEFHLKGRTYLSEATPESFDAAVGMFELTIDFDPDYAPAHAGLADALAELFTIRGDEALRKRAGEHAQRAVDLAPELAETHISRGHVLTVEERYDEAAKELDLAISINPRSAEAHYRYGHVRVREGKLDASAEMFERASRLQPADFRPTLQLAWIYRALGRERDAADAESRTNVLRALRK
ncbi:MAG TPA: winged helix-turn-helix domain-containing protein [Thermoanaerobaculia bacterium]|nr:winged helix-turn-helix domain-containing protein [Thermoanaerobaculia bacterium]